MTESLRPNTEGVQNDMRLFAVAFSRRGYELALKIKEKMTEHECSVFVKCSALGELSEKRKISECMAEWVSEADGIIFVSSCGIAVRLIAPYVNDKRTDCAVTVVDENGRFAISLLSGHIGGANELTEELAEKISAEPVITTATDGRGLFAVDVFAEKNDMFISDMKAAKKISAALLEGERIGVVSDYPVTGALPKGLIDKWEAVPKNGIVISDKNNTENLFENTLKFVPRTIYCGIGCRKNTGFADIENAVLSAFKEIDLNIKALKCVSSIDLKKNESGINELCGKYKIPFYTYTAEELKAVEGDFTESEFVQSITGVGSVCERSAVRCSDGELIMHKKVYNSVTVALADKKRGIDFEN